MIRVVYVEGSDYPDPPFLVGVFTTMSAAEEARDAFVKRMMTPRIPYRFELEVDTRLQESESA